MHLSCLKVRRKWKISNLILWPYKSLLSCPLTYTIIYLAYTNTCTCRGVGSTEVVRCTGVLTSWELVNSCATCGLLSGSGHAPLEYFEILGAFRGAGAIRVILGHISGILKYQISVDKEWTVQQWGSYDIVVNYIIIILKSPNSSWGACFYKRVCTSTKVLLSSLSYLIR